jgi:hypothetical protein
MMTVEGPHRRFVSTVSEMLGGLCVSVAFPQIMVFGKAMWQPLTGGECGVVRNRCSLCISTSMYQPYCSTHYGTFGSQKGKNEHGHTFF